MQAKGENGDAVIDKSSANWSISPDTVSSIPLWSLPLPFVVPIDIRPMVIKRFGGGYI